MFISLFQMFVVNSSCPTLSEKSRFKINTIVKFSVVVITMTLVKATLSSRLLRLLNILLRPFWSLSLFISLIDSSTHPPFPTELNRFQVSIVFEKWFTFH